MKPRFQLAIFDWDGTMMLTTEAIVESIRYTCTLLGYKDPGVEKTRSAIGLGRADTMEYLVPECPKEKWEEFEELYRERYLSYERTISLVTGMRELLYELRANNVKLAVATGKSERGLNRVLTANDLVGFFDTTRVGAIKNPKPNPAMILEILEELQIKKENAVMIGDSKLDLQMALNAGVAAIGVSYGATTKVDLMTLPNVGVAKDVKELRSFLFS